MQDDNSPAPGSHEYDMEMARRYQQQGHEAPLTESGLKTSDYRQVTSQTGTSVGVRKDSTYGAPGPAAFSAAQADPAQVSDLEREIAQIREQLAQVHHFDPVTGDPVMLYTGEARQLRETRLAHLEFAELPATQALVKTAQDWRAKNVESPEEALARQKADRAAITARAEEIVQERAAQAEAERLLRSRGSGLGIK